MNNNYIRHIILLFAATLIAALAPSCTDELPVPNMPDYTEAGRDVTATFTVTVPQMEVKSRADIDNAGLYAVHSLYVATFSSVTGQITSMDENGNNLGWQKVDVEENPAKEHIEYKISIHTKTGPSYIVAVANVENYGVRSDSPNLQNTTIKDLLATANTWEKFLNIGVAASENQLYAPSTTNGLVMSGIYLNRKHSYSESTGWTPRYDDWEGQNFMSYTIPYANGATVEMQGAIHLRRLVSQVTFNIYTGLKDPKDEKNNDITVTPHSYTVYNAPNHSWLYERGDASASAIQNRKNFDDNCTADTKGTLYRTQAFSSQYISASEDDKKRALQTFNFWMTENKHTAAGVADYNARNAYTTATEGGDRIFTALNSAWTPANMATYVVINCTVEFNYDKDKPTPPLTVDQNGNPVSNGDGVYRSGTGNFIVHLGYVGDDLNDFNCYRNVDYNYNIYINGLDDIRVEATASTVTNGVEGIVTDMEEKTIFLDAHYHQFNVYLTDEELKAWKTNPGGSSEGFGFIITTYDNLNGGMKTYDESDFIENDDYKGLTYEQIIAKSPELKKYLDWVEFRPTTGQYVFAQYKSRATQRNSTFNLIDAARGEVLTNNRYHSSSGWYTCFVKEYTYDYSDITGADGANESALINGRPQWFGYVNADPRQFYIRVTKAISADGQSTYARAKYGTQQKSILTYYSTDDRTASSESGKVEGSAVGIEHTNETFGLNLRSLISEMPSSFKDNLSDVNGRYNCYQFTNYYWTTRNGWSTRGSDIPWSDYIYYDNNDRSLPMTIPYQATVSEDRHHLPRLLYKYRHPEYKGTNYDPIQNSTEVNDFIEAISACMNRNRDNNGDGYIDRDEIRWYVPTSAKYIRMIIGSKSLGSEALVDYTDIKDRDSKIGSNDKWGEMLFYGSNERILWAMEGLSLSNYSNIFSHGYTYPWQIRCIRSLGINLTDVKKDDQTIPAYTKEEGTNGSTIIKPKYYSTANLRPNRYTGNGTGSGKMPVHRIQDTQYNSVYINGFEVESEPDFDTYYVENISDHQKQWTEVRTKIHSTDSKQNRCAGKGSGWRLPNLVELAIMHSEGLISRKTYAVWDSNDNKYVYPEYYTFSCSVTPYNSKGTVETLDDDEKNYELRYYLKSSGERITQGSPGNRFVFRCVRDLQ